MSWNQHDWCSRGRGISMIGAQRGVELARLVLRGSWTCKSVIFICEMRYANCDMQSAICEMRNAEYKISKKYFKFKFCVIIEYS